MFHFSSKLIVMAIIFSCLFFYLVSCGGNTAVPVVETPSGEFASFVAYARGITPAEYTEKWNNKINISFKFSYYGENNITWPDNDSPEQIYNSHIVNCYRISLLLQYIYGGELIFVSQPTSNYDHYYLLLQNGDIINNTNDGKLMTLKYIKAGKI